MLAFFGMLWYYIRAVRRQQQMKIRVWRSLVSRLNGVQEASSSNLDTRTMKTEGVFALSVFIFYLRFEQYNTTVRWTVACRRLDGGNTLILIPEGNQNAANLGTRTISVWNHWYNGSIRSFSFMFDLYWKQGVLITIWPFSCRSPANENGFFCFTAWSSPWWWPSNLLIVNFIGNRFIIG